MTVIVTDTDHYPFVARGLPGIVIGTGSYIHIHEPGDESGRLDYALLRDRANYVFQFLVESANLDGKFDFTGGVDGYYGVIGSPPTDAELLTRRVSAQTQALKVSAVIPGMEGQKAGIKPGDLITGINGKELDQTEDGYFTLADVVGDLTVERIDVTIIREAETVALQLKNQHVGE